MPSSPMVLRAGLAILVHAIVTAAFPASDPLYHRITTRQSSLTWTPCYNDTNLECAFHDPPLDYSNPSAGNAHLAVIRYKATRTPKLGSVFVNPGGPGGSGVQFVAAGGDVLSNATGGYYDIVSWDPRGVNNSLPRIHCFQTAMEERAFFGRSIPWYGIEAHTGFNSSVDIENFYARLNETDGVLDRLGQACLSANGDNLRYIGTVATVRDLVGLAEATDGPTSLINYIGFSYGTIIGAYLVNMFPSRVGRVFLDGVVNPEVWSDSPAYKSAADQYQDSEKVLQAFYDECAAAGSRCAYNLRGTSSASEIQARLLNLLDDVFVAARSGFPIGTENLRDYIFGYLYTPRYWDDLANDLLYVEGRLAGLNKSTTPPTSKLDAEKPRAKLFGTDPLWYLGGRQAVHDYLELPISNDGDGSRSEKRQAPDTGGSDYGQIAIFCSDGIDAGSVTTKDVFDEIVRVAKEVTPFFGPTFNTAAYFCHHWRARAAERYTGPWNASLPNGPILVIGNKADPITPLNSAEFLADQLGDSAIFVEHEGYGHTTLAMYSECTVGIVSKYFISGQLPPTDGTACQTNEPLFYANSTNELVIPLASTISPSAVPTATATVPAAVSEAVTTATGTSGSAKRTMGWWSLVAFGNCIIVLLVGW